VFDRSLVIASIASLQNSDPELMAQSRLRPHLLFNIYGSLVLTWLAVGQNQLAPPQNKMENAKDDLSVIECDQIAKRRGGHAETH
jgi:hypothetical protein